jgi:hypothetical protein
MATNTSGNRKNSANTSIIGPACSQATKDLRSSVMETPTSGQMEKSVKEFASMSCRARKERGRTCHDIKRR